jgi:hypothetical protein
MTISIPLVVFVLDEISSVCGLASAVMMAARAKRRNINNNGFNRVRKLSEEKPLILDIFKAAVSSFRLKKYHTPAKGSSSSNQKNPGLANWIFSNIYTSVFTSMDTKIRSTI